MTEGNLDKTERRARVARLARAGAAAALLAWQVYAFHDVRHDDPFITYRYAQNLATGHGLTFNPGERFLGATSPGHMLLASLVYSLVGRDATPSVMSALSCVGWSAQAIAVYFLLVPVVGGFGATVSAAAVELGAARSFMWVAFEANLVAAFSLWALVAAQRRRWLLAATLAALACLMRPDASLLAALLLGTCLWELRAKARSPLTVFALLTLPWVGFAWAYYGSPLPHSAVEKFQRALPRPYFEHAVRLLGETVLPFASSLAWLPLSWAALCAGAFILARRDRTLRMLVGYALLHLSAYLVLRPFTGHDWHLYPLNLIGVVVVTGGLASFTTKERAPWLRAVSAVLLLGLVLLDVQRTTNAAHTYHLGRWTGARDQTYRRIADYLRLRAAPDDQFACVEVGTLAYYSNLSAYDLGGLVTDLRRVNMVERPVRWLVLDKTYLAHAPPWAPVFSAAAGDFEAFVYYLPKRDATR